MMVDDYYKISSARHKPGHFFMWSWKETLLILLIACVNFYLIANPFFSGTENFSSAIIFPPGIIAIGLAEIPEFGINIFYVLRNIILHLVMPHKYGMKQRGYIRWKN